MAHGLLFVGYIILAFLLKEQQNWPIKKFLIVALASVVPFGTFYIEWKYFKTPQSN
jgi:integral membrane protein